MRKLSGYTQIEDIDLFYSEAYQKHALGEVAETSDGARFVYAKAGAVALTRGNLTQSPALDVNYQGLTATASINALTVTVTLGASAVTANQFAGGYLLVTNGAGEGQLFDILAHDAALAGAAVVMSIGSAVQTALAASTVTLMLNPFNGVIAHPIVATGTVAGVAAANIASGQYGWLQIKGVCPTLGDAGIAIGQTVVPSTATAGAVMLATAVTETAVGSATEASSAGQSRGVYLMLG